VTCHLAFWGIVSENFKLLTSIQPLHKHFIFCSPPFFSADRQPTPGHFSRCLINKQLCGGIGVQASPRGCGVHGGFFGGLVAHCCCCQADGPSGTTASPCPRPWPLNCFTVKKHKKTNSTLRTTNCKIPCTL